MTWDCAWAVQVEKESLWIRHQLSCSVIGSSSAVPDAGGQRGKASWSHMNPGFFPMVRSDSSKLTERWLSKN